MLFAPKVPCVACPSLHLIKPSFTLWGKGISNCGFVSAWQLKQSFGCATFNRLSSAPGLCTLWQLVQLTPAFACGERRKFGCVPAWQPKQVASTSLGDILLICFSLVASPPLSTWAFPGPWQLSQVAPWPPCSKASLECGFVSNFLATSAWQVAQTSEPTKSPGSGAAAFCNVAACLFPLAAYPTTDNPGSNAINPIHNRKRFIQPSAEASRQFPVQ